MVNFVRYLPGGIGLGVLAVSALAAEPLAQLEARWVALKYEHAGDRDRQAKADSLERDSAAAAAAEPTPAALLLEANVLCLSAEFMHSSGSLGKVKKARDLLQTAEREAPEDPAVLAALGSIYYEVPGWPIGFGDRKKAERYLRRALAADPTGRDPNFFMGDFLVDSGHAADAIPFLERALAAPQQNDLMDRGRREEINQSLAKARRQAKR